MSCSPLFRVCVVCTGNICRSPMGEVVLRAMVEDQGLGHVVTVDSAGLSDWHVGDGADPRTLTALGNAGYDGSAHLAREFDLAWFAERDLVLAADVGHQRALRGLARDAGGPQRPGQIRLLREFDADAAARGDVELDDPYYGGARDFRRCLEEVEASCRGLVAHLLDGACRTASQPARQPARRPGEAAGTQSR
ncbi:MAG TPA: low molecular weight protein-tyrosine-phosphatase [Dermatophilaceae bacterium]|nr:low molecular weight protein-tyrosine-phosphatase [Dermatophilaceae bacterium]